MNLPWKKRPGTTVLGIAVEQDRFEVIELRRTNGSSEIRRSLSIPWEADPMAGDAPSVGRALRAQLQQAGIRESRCAVALPAHLFSTLAVAVPDLPEPDRQSFLELEAERGFAQAADDLFIRTSQAGPGHATLVAVDRESVHRLEAVLHAAHLKPVAFTLGLSALQPPPASESDSSLALLPSGSRLTLQVCRGRGLVMLRTIEDAFQKHPETSEWHADLDLISRELRITLGQLPREIREGLEVARVFGPSDQARGFVDAITPRATVLGLRVEQVPDYRPGQLPFRLPTHAPAAPALAVAVRRAAGLTEELDYLPPRVSAWRQFATQHASRRTAWAMGAAGGTLALATLCFLGQQLFLWKWRSRWDGMKAKVTQIEGMQREVRRYEPWFDPSVRSLSILRRLTESFPEDGSVSAKSIEFRSPSRVACSGTARDPQSWLRVLDALRNAPGVSDLQVEQVRGKSPIEFSLHFTWQPQNRS